MADNRCFGRLVDDSKTGRFGDGHKFHLELRCTRKTIHGTKLCGICHEKTRDFNTRTSSGKKIQHPQVLHGLIDEPIPFESHIFEGPWYQKRLKDWGEPCAEEMARGKKAQLEANGGAAPAAAPAPTAAPAAAPKKRGPKKAVVDTPVPDALPAVAPKKKREPKSANVIVVPQPQIEQQQQPRKIEAVAKESLESSIEEKNVLFIKVRRFHHNGKKYFLDSKKNKVYTIGNEKSKGAYYGRWNPESETIDTTFPDSDAE